MNSAADEISEEVVTRNWSIPWKSIRIIIHGRLLDTIQVLLSDKLQENVRVPYNIINFTAEAGNSEQAK